MASAFPQYQAGRGSHQPSRLEPGALMTRIADTADVDERALSGDASSFGRGAYIGPGVRLGAACRVQSYALVEAGTA